MRDLILIKMSHIVNKAQACIGTFIAEIIYLKIPLHDFKCCDNEDQ